MLPNTKRMEVHYLEFLIDKLRMEKELKGISEENSLTFPWCAKFFKKFPWLFQVLEDFLRKKKQWFSRFSRICGNPATIRSSLIKPLKLVHLRCIHFLHFGQRIESVHIRSKITVWVHSSILLLFLQYMILFLCTLILESWISRPNFQASFFLLLLRLTLLN